MYKGGSFKFTFSINNNYPHDAPKVKCVPKVSLVSEFFFSHYSLPLNDSLA